MKWQDEKREKYKRYNIQKNNDMDVDVTSKKPVRLAGVIHLVYKSTPDWSAGKIKNHEGRLIGFSGNLCAKVGQQVVLIGHFVKHEIYGIQFKVVSMEVDLKLNKNGLINYLAMHPDIKGIGPVKAKKIIDTLGDDFEKTLINNPGAINNITHLPDGTVDALRKDWLDNSMANKVKAHLAAYGLTHHQIMTLVQKHGVNTLNILNNNPYALIMDIHNYGFKKVDDIARKLGTRKDAPGRIRAGIMYCVQDALNHGHCWIGYKELIHTANELLIMDTRESKNIIKTLLDALIKEERLISQKHNEGRHIIALPRIWGKCQWLASVFGKLRGENPHAQRLTKTADLAARSLNDDQQQALNIAKGHPITLISGGAGSGKSYTIARIREMYDDAGLTVVLSAPTGKAAMRLKELSGQEGTTIHRLLEYNGQGFTKDCNNPIDADVVIIDEFSMVDIELAWHLFQALDLERTAIIIVGDHNQLPPVGPGNILRDLINARAVPTTILDKIVRQAGTLKRNSIAILRGEVKKTAETQPNKTPGWLLYSNLTAPSAVYSFLMAIFETRVKKLGKHINNNMQVLTPTKKGELGTRALNLGLQRLLQKHLYAVTVQPVKEGHKPKLYRYDKVIQTKNDYKLNVMNGAIGTVTWIDKNGIHVDFDGNEVEITSASGKQKHLQLAYALTIHKAQGSEFPCVISVIHKSHSFMHHRNLFYTAVTRASDTAIIVGDRWGINNCAMKSQVDKRRTLLGVMLNNDITTKRENCVF